MKSGTGQVRQECARVSVNLLSYESRSCVNLLSCMHEHAKADQLTTPEADQLSTPAVSVTSALYDPPVHAHHHLF